MVILLCRMPHLPRTSRRAGLLNMVMCIGAYKTLSITRDMQLYHTIKTTSTLNYQSRFHFRHISGLESGVSGESSIIPRVVIGRRPQRRVGDSPADPKGLIIPPVVITILIGNQTALTILTRLALVFWSICHNRG